MRAEAAHRQYSLPGEIMVPIRALLQHVQPMIAWIVWDDDYVVAVFDNEPAAKAFAGERYVEEREVWSVPPPPWKYWHRGAEVYPDGHVSDWCRELAGEGAVSIPPVDDALNLREQPWDGHTQGHCGEHISISGTDRALVEAAFQRALSAALARQDGACKCLHTHRGVIDGRDVYEAGFLKVRQRGRPDAFRLACFPYADHDWTKTEAGNEMCSRCCSFVLRVTTTVIQS